MQLKPTARAGRALFVAFLAAIAITAGTAANADDAGTVPSVQADNSVGSVRGAYYLFQNSHVHKLVGDGAGGGVTITIDHHATQDRTSLAVDYLNASKDGNTVRIIPAMIEFQSYQSEKAGYHPYIAYGAGIIFANVTDSTNVNLTGGKAGSVMGFEFGYGVDLKSKIYVEARYLLAGSIEGDSLSGPELYLGFRL